MTMAKCNKEESSVENHMMIQDLPEELLLHILSFVLPSDVCANVAQVCRSWRDLAFSPSLWHDCDYVCNGDRNATERDTIFRNAPCLRSLTIAALGCTDPSSVLESLENRAISISKLTLSGRRLDSDFFHIVSRHFEGVEKLILRDVRLRHDDYVALGRMRTIRSIEIGSDCISWIGLQTLVSSCPRLASLQVGALSCDDETDDKELALIEMLTSLSNTLIHCHLLGPLEHSDRILQAFHSCSRLQTLEINDCASMEGDGLVNGIMALSLLERVTLRDLRYVPSWTIQKYLLGADLKKLRHLDIAGCSMLEDDCLFELSNRCPSLESLNIRGCENVTDQGVSAILDMCPNLHSLELWGLKHLTGACFRFSLPPMLPKLKVIDLRFCLNVPPELLRKLEMRGRRVVW